MLIHLLYFFVCLFDFLFSCLKLVCVFFFMLVVYLFFCLIVRLFVFVATVLSSAGGGVGAGGHLVYSHSGRIHGGKEGSVAV